MARTVTVSSGNSNKDNTSGSNGNICSDQNSSCIRKVSATGTITVMRAVRVARTAIVW